MRISRLSKMVCAVILFCAATAIPSPAQTFTTVLSFDGTNGAYPGSVIQATDGNFYGTTSEGGTSGNCGQGSGCGTVFKVTPGGTLTPLHSFDLTDGFSPEELLQATDGNFYGTTRGGGTGNCLGCGTVFKITPNGMLTSLYTFCSQLNCPNGSSPNPLVQAADRNFYGTTEFGGVNINCTLTYGCGTVFKITAGGTLTTLHSFADAEGYGPFAGLMQAADGNFYGTTYVGGTLAKCDFSYFDSCGTVFNITPAGTLTTLHSFQGYPIEGANSYSTLVQAADGNFYGTTAGGGANDNRSCTSPDDLTGCGTVFKITPGGTLTTLYSFCSQPNCADGYFPSHGLVQATDGNFYGMTEFGGANDNCARYGVTGCGTVFKITPGGTLTTLYSFCSQPNCADGSVPGVLLQATDGTFYGTTFDGGANGYGTVFKLSEGLAGRPSITIFMPRIGRVGTSVVITGGNLNGATSVTFGGTKAKSFTVESSTQIRATVPAGARTGKIGATTPDGKATSAGTFTVL